MGSYEMYHLRQLLQVRKLQGVTVKRSVYYLGNRLVSLAEQLIHYGADRVITVEHPNLAQYTSDGYSQAFMAILEQEKPEGIVFGHTALGKDLSPKIAAKIGSGLVSDATSIEEQDGEVIFTRPIYSGKAFEKLTVTEGIVFATIRPNNIEPLEKDSNSIR